MDSTKLHLSGPLWTVSMNLANTLGWNGTFGSKVSSEFAKQFHLRVEGTNDIFLNGSFAGQLIAPHAHVIVGQAVKQHAGQIFPRSITLHQDTKFTGVKGN